MTITSVIQIYRGDTPKFSFSVKDAAGAEFDLTNAKVYFAAKQSGASEYLFDLECTITDVPGGLCEIRLTATHTGTIGTYRAEVEVRVTDGPSTYVYTAWQGDLVIKDDVRKGT